MNVGAVREVEASPAIIDGRRRGVGRRAAFARSAHALELVNRIRDDRFVHLRHFETLADAAQQGDVQLAAQVLAELAKALRSAGPPAARALVERVVPEPESERFEQAKDALGDGLDRGALPRRIHDVERDADRDGFAVAQPMVRHRLELVGRPVAEVERPRAAQLERIAVAADVREVQFGGPRGQRRDDGRSPLAMFATLRFEIAEERGVAQQRHLDGLADAADAVARLSVSRNRESLMTANGGDERADEVLLAEQLMLFLTPTPESACESTVVGKRTTRTPRWAMAAANDTMSSTAPPPMTTTNDCRSRPTSLIRFNISSG